MPPLRRCKAFCGEKLSSTVIQNNAGCIYTDWQQTNDATGTGGATTLSLTEHSSRVAGQLGT
ncbi:hypothetical protein M406DRAFT_101583 [Cryphonectria parasitica EP155]|uniref:Uncharacterized protein n=1 Tax=Cryphonectria parasitica (strain ATCC 38755 / EP155) TaxID=660469 RepID=A0A9P4Y4Q5_CRYP1|nr:uncharacterized protein M406DRAFT_101583 [Cryphonectria parasitica EP155]KAF3766125.1 hypothetical protein M406DRAFT_101583 [Cryphonectria parasitica EP155]